MNFRTEINIAPENQSIDYNSNIVLFGSCFTENISKQFDYFKFENYSNSHGILFHSKAIEKAINDCIKERTYTAEDLTYFNELWLSLNHHTKFSSDSSNQVLNSINSEIAHCNNEIQKASHVIITLGTAWVYKYLDSNEIASNCHKIPQRNFKKELLSIDEIVQSLENIITEIKGVNPNAIFIFTVSPVRHLKDGFAQNSLSKSHLISSIHKIIDNQTSFYFPSYEIMLDDLRDYRFYKEDMVHPNNTAINYIWELFKKTWIHEDSYPLMKEIDGIQKSLLHKPFNVNSNRHQAFLKKNEGKMAAISKKYPQINFNKKRK